jgi:N-acetylmuramoyl-L-alanine amidase/putative methionine-R-sulfoxide reductase with GAF domain
MATTPTKPSMEPIAHPASERVPAWPASGNGFGSTRRGHDSSTPELRPAGRDALQALLAFSAMHQQVRRRRALAARVGGFEAVAAPTGFEPQEQPILDEVLQLVAERAIAITGADGLGIALAENDEIVLRASAGMIKPDVGARVQRDSAFSGACFRTAQIIRCDDSETDDRVNVAACRQLGARSMVAVPLCGRRRVIGLLEAFSAEPFGFNDSDVASLELLAELVIAALKPEDEDRLAEAAQVAEKKLKVPKNEAPTTASPSTALPATAIEAEKAAVQAKEVSTKPSVAAQALPKERHPGIVLISILVIVAVLLGGGLWWGLKTGWIERAFQQAVAKQSAAPTPSPQAPSASSAGDSSANSAIAPSATANAQPNSSDAQTADEAQASLPGEESGKSEDASKLAHITGIRHWSSADSSTVVLDLEDQVQYEAHRLANPDRIYFDLHDTSLASELAGKTIEIGDPLLARIRVAQPVSGLTRLVLETKGDSNYSVSLEPSPYRLLVQLTRVGAAPKAQINLFPGSGESAQKPAIVVPPPTKQDLQLRAHVPKMRIVVDAGHGGWDLGTVGRGGLLEKDLVLEIAQRLGKLLESRLGAEVILTRNDDNYIPLDERADMANHAQADLFVSVHANYSDLPSARGVETYYTNLFSAPNVKEMETNGAGPNPSVTIASLTPAALVDKIQQSRLLAASVQRSLYGALLAGNPGLRDRGVKEASYVVLTETAMPGILAEVSFVSSPTDEQKLRNDGYREEIAEALYRGIARYAANAHGVKLAYRQ